VTEIYQSAIKFELFDILLRGHAALIQKRFTVVKNSTVTYASEQMFVHLNIAMTHFPC
jgi:hypothetical protein